VVSRLIKIADWTGAKRGNVIFVHGLGGHPYSTWQRSADESTLWPRWLAEDVKGLAVFSFGYVSPPTNWIGTAMPLLDEAANALRVLLNNEELKSGPIAFVCHSLGGLIVKQVIRAANEQNRSPDLSDFLGRISKVIFIATPHTGSGSATLLERARFLIWGSDSARDLVANNSGLRDLNFGYREIASARDGHLNHLAYYEMMDTVFNRIVKPDSADPGLPNCRPVPIRKTHITIVKPESRDDLVYIETRKFLFELGPEPDNPGALRTFATEPFDLGWSWQALLPKLARFAAILVIAYGLWYGVPRIRAMLRDWSQTESNVKQTQKDVVEVKSLLAKLLISGAQAGPAQEQALAKTLEATHDGATGGDTRLRDALEL
jgi:pimeloyl-ACP methyl ester carboxylesterase